MRYKGSVLFLTKVKSTKKNKCAISGTHVVAIEECTDSHTPAMTGDGEFDGFGSPSYGVDTREEVPCLLHKFLVKHVFHACMRVWDIDNYYVFVLKAATPFCSLSTTVHVVVGAKARRRRGLHPTNMLPR